MMLIGLSGKKRTGKNTVAKYISLLATNKVEEFSFADALKNDVARLLRVPRHEIDKHKDLYRGMLQAYGVYMRTKYGEDWWVIKTFEQMVKSNADIVLVTDVRFLNEAEWIRKSSGILVRVSRDTGLHDEHESEIALDKYNYFDHIILNKGSLNDLMQDTKDLLHKLKINIK